MIRAMVGLIVAALATAAPLDAHGARGPRGGGLFGASGHGHPINAWMGGHHQHLR